MSENPSKRELLKDKVVDLVKEFVNTEGKITSNDIGFALAQANAALNNSPLTFLTSPES